MTAIANLHVKTFLRPLCVVHLGCNDVLDLRGLSDRQRVIIAVRITFAREEVEILPRLLDVLVPAYRFDSVALKRYWPFIF